MLDTKATFLERNVDAVAGELETAPSPKYGVPWYLVLFYGRPFPWAGCVQPEGRGLAALLEVCLNGGLDDR